MTLTRIGYLCVHVQESLDIHICPLSHILACLYASACDCTYLNVVLSGEFSLNFSFQFMCICVRENMSDVACMKLCNIMCVFESV
uniref:Uncharacterized protein n=1 Tax=Octopus bimaculoides TaxID=37653 RepID=A0A0L8GBY5_OCTBM